MIDLSEDLKKKLLKLYQSKKYSEFENLVESIGNIKELPLYLQTGYAGSKVLNPNSKQKDYLISNSIFNDAIKKDKNNLEILYNFILSSLYAEEFYQVIPYVKKRLNEDPSDKKVIEGAARINFFLGNMDISIHYFKKLMDMHAEDVIDGGRLTYLATMNYPSGVDQSLYLSECMKLNSAFNKNSTFKGFKRLTKKNLTKIKVGFLSGDFRIHSVGFFLIEFLKNLEKDEFQLFGFSNLELDRHDNITKEFKKIFDNWFDTINLSDSELIDVIRDENIDILIDLSGFTFGNRINIFAARCAPTQICWLGYNNSVGIDNMDYLITDHNLIFKNEEKLYSEKIIYMPKIWNCMGKPNNLPDIEPIPCLTKDVFSFGSFNNFQKISNDTIKVWSKILNKSNSQIYLKNSSGYNKELYEVLFNKFIANGVDPKKIIFLKKKNQFEEHLKDYNKIDLALDTFPYTGVTTSFQAYTMGVPVLTLEGFNFNSRCGASINKNLGLDDLIAKNHDEYIEKAIYYIDNRFVLNSIIDDLRNKTLDSPLYDIHNYTYEFSNILKNLYKDQF